jgi:hypothetical protein
VLTENRKMRLTDMSVALCELWAGSTQMLKMARQSGR